MFIYTQCIHLGNLNIPRTKPTVLFMFSQNHESVSKLNVTEQDVTKAVTKKVVDTQIYFLLKSDRNEDCEVWKWNGFINCQSNMLKQMFHLCAWRMGQARSAAILKDFPPIGASPGCLSTKQAKLLPGSWLCKHCKLKLRGVIREWFSVNSSSDNKFKFRPMRKLFTLFLNERLKKIHRYHCCFWINRDFITNSFDTFHRNKR